jgi:hypothetical protein
MGPIFNPLDWFVGFIVIAIPIFIGGVVGLAAYAASSRLAKRYTRRAQWVGLPIAFVTALGACSLAFCGLCQWVLFEPGTTQREPTKDDVVGTWSPTDYSLQQMRDEGGYEISTHTLTFREDGTFEMTNMPDWWLDFGESTGGFYSGSGTWELFHWTIELHFTSLPGHTGLVTNLYVGERESRYFVYDFIGDPDSGKVMKFEKQQ